MNPKLSDHMPAQQDSMLPAKMDASQESDAPAYPGEGGSDTAPTIDMSQMTPKTVKWENVDDNKPGWEIGTDEQKGPSWELEDRKDENG